MAALLSYQRSKGCNHGPDKGTRGWGSEMNGMSALDEQRAAQANGAHNICRHLLPDFDDYASRPEALALSTILTLKKELSVSKAIFRKFYRLSR